MEALKTIFKTVKLDLEQEKAQTFYEGVLADRWSNHEAAGQDIWPGASQENRRVYLSRLKKSLVGRIVDKVLFLPGNSAYQSAYNDCWRRMCAVQILRGMGQRKAVNWLAKRTLQKAMKYDLTEVVCNLAQALELHESLIGDQREYEKYQALTDQYRDIQSAELKAFRYFNTLSNHFRSSQNVSPELIAQAEAYTRELMLELDHYDSFRYIFYTYNLRAITAQMKKDPIELHHTCREALEIFEAKSYPMPRAVQFSFTFKPIPFAINFQRYDQAEEHIIRALKMVEHGSYNYVLCLYYQAILGLHSGRHHLVEQAISGSIKHRHYPAIRQHWKIIEAYAAFLDIGGARGFRVAKFLNEVPIMEKDKRGSNILLLIIQVLFHLKRREHGKIIDKMEALQTYTQRYLRKDHTYRAECFLHMLTALPRGNFHPVAVERHARKYADKMKAFPCQDIEIVPFEVLWGKILDLL